ncbi:MAG: CopG family transcriptional regulator [Actinomycetota bacterium]
MRTTLNLDADIAASLSEKARLEGTSRSRAANELIRAGLRHVDAPEAAGSYQPPTFDTGRPLVDMTDIACVLEILDRGD